MKRSQLARSAPLARHTPLGSAPRPSAPDPAPEAVPRRSRPTVGQKFREVSMQPCRRCGPKKVKRTAHHIVSQNALRRYVQSLRLLEDEGRRLERRLINDTRNAMSLCPDCHMGFEARSMVIVRELLPADVWQFAAEIGTEFVMRIERAYPPMKGR